MNPKSCFSLNPFCQKVAVALLIFQTNDKNNDLRRNNFKQDANHSLDDNGKNNSQNEREAFGAIKHAHQTTATNDNSTMSKNC